MYGYDSKNCNKFLCSIFNLFFNDVVNFIENQLNTDDVLGFTVKKALFLLIPLDQHPLTLLHLPFIIY